MHSMAWGSWSPENLTRAASITSSSLDITSLYPHASTGHEPGGR
jgi:hypothetical protein